MDIKYKRKECDKMVSISIIVPVYNASQYLKQCIDSILTQSFKDFELILINDGSTDNSLNICREYEAIDSRVIVIDGPNGGVSSARNKGLDIAKGEWITFVDADDYFLEDALQTFYQHTISTKASLILGNLLRLKNNSLTMIHNLNDEIISNVMFGIRHIALWGYLIKSDVIQKNKLRFIKGLAYSEDCVFIYQLAGLCSSMAVSAKPVYVHRVNETSACSSLNVQNTFNHQMDASYYLKDLARSYLNKDKRAYHYLLKKSQQIRLLGISVLFKRNSQVQSWFLILRKYQSRFGLGSMPTFFIFLLAEYAKSMLCKIARTMSF